MKRALAGLALLLCVTAANAFDSWTEETFNYETGETVFKSGFENLLLIGPKGVAYSRAVALPVDSFGNDVKIKIDDAAVVQLPITQIGANTVLISNSKEFISKVANAKRVEISLRRCYISICTLSKTGGLGELIWRFEVPLAEQFKDYQERIR